MKLLAFALFASQCLASVSVYRLGEVAEKTQVLGSQDGVLKLADEFGVSDLYDLGKISDASLLNINAPPVSLTRKSKLVVKTGSVDGFGIPSIQVSGNELVSHFISSLGSNYARAHDLFMTRPLSRVQVIGKQTVKDEMKELSQGEESFSMNREESISLQVERLADILKRQSSSARLAIVDLVDVKVSQDTIDPLLNLVDDRLDIVVVSSGVKLAKRSVSSSMCFLTQEDCESLTDSCSNHGTCVQVGKCFKCACGSTFDKKKSKTTRWAGDKCAQKDVSVEFNLFLWTGVALLAAIVMGSKMLFAMGSEPLPGLLSAATAPKKSS